MAQKEIKAYFPVLAYFQWENNERARKNMTAFG